VSPAPVTGAAPVVRRRRSGSRREDAAGKPIELRLFARSQSATDQRVGKLIAGWLEAVGLQIDLQVIDENAMSDKIGQDAAAAAAAGGRVVFRGRVVSFDWEERDGFTWGELELAGEAADAGSSYRIWSKNENLLAWRDGVPDVTAPDLTCCFSAETGEPITNPHHEPGAAVTVVGIPAAPQWRSTVGVATLGPRHFGFDLDYVPLEAGVPAGPGMD
jgi:DUF917 family protein